jgi:hypothetical protein
MAGNASPLAASIIQPLPLREHISSVRSLTGSDWKRRGVRVVASGRPNGVGTMPFGPIALI